VTRDDKVLLQIEVEGKLMLTTADYAEAIADLLELGVLDPAPLVAAVHQWGAVEVHQGARVS
jgi:hypothetical protein